MGGGKEGGRLNTHAVPLFGPAFLYAVNSACKHFDYAVWAAFLYAVNSTCKHIGYAVWAAFLVAAKHFDHTLPYAMARWSLQVYIDVCLL